MALPMAMYGVVIGEAITKGNLAEMRELATVSAYLLRNQDGELDVSELEAWRDAHKQLTLKILEAELK